MLPWELVLTNLPPHLTEKLFRGVPPFLFVSDINSAALENPMDGEAWWAAVHGVAKSRTWSTSLSLFTFMHWRRKWQPTPVFLPGESQGRGSQGAAVYGAAQSRTRLKRLSSSSLTNTCKYEEERGLRGAFSLNLCNREIVIYSR